MNPSHDHDPVSLEYGDLASGVSEAESRTGRKRVAQVIVGVCLVLAGIAMLVIPGPGVVTLLVGLNMIKPDNALVRWLRQRVPGVPVEGRVPTLHIIVGVCVMVVSTVVAMLWGDDVYKWCLDSLKSLFGADD